MDTYGDDQFRARDWSEYVGQESLKQRLDIHIEAAIEDNRYLDHTLLYAPPGSGKTTLARIVADRLGDPLLEMVCPIKPAVFANELRQWPGGILFLDEIHRASKSQQEDLLPLLEQSRYVTPNRDTIEFRHLTVIGATTEPDKVIPALFDRFPIKPAFEEYSDSEMALIVERMAKRLGVSLEWDDCVKLGIAAGGIPRNGRQFVLAARDLACSGQTIVAEDILRFCGYETDGLDSYAMRYLEVLRMLGGQAGLPTLSSHLRLSPTIIREIERVLVRQRLITFEARGRSLSQGGWARLRRGYEFAGRVA